MQLPLGIHFPSATNDVQQRDGVAAAQDVEHQLQSSVAYHWTRPWKCYGFWTSLALFSSGSGEQVARENLVD